MYLEKTHCEDNFSITSNQYGELVFTDKNGAVCLMPEEFRNSSCPTKGPLVVHLELTRRCGIACKHCYISAGKARSNELSASEWKNILVQLQELEVLSVYLTGGDPLLHPDCIEIVNFATNLGLSCNILTNGIEIDKGVGLDQFPREAFWVLSYDGLLGTQILRGFPGEIVLRATQRLKEANCAFALQGLVFSGNVEEMPETILQCKDREINFALIDVLPIGRAKENPWLLLNENQIDKALEIERLWHESYGGAPFILPSHAVANPDIYTAITRISFDSDRPEPGVTVAYISSDGFMYPDNYYAAEGYFGAIDVRTSPIGEVWAKAFDKIRGMRRSDFHGCRVCPLSIHACDLQNTEMSKFIYGQATECGAYPVLKRLKMIRDI